MVCFRQNLPIFFFLGGGLCEDLKSNHGSVSRPLLLGLSRQCFWRFGRGCSFWALPPYRENGYVGTRLFYSIRFIKISEKQDNHPKFPLHSEENIRHLNF